MNVLANLSITRKLTLIIMLTSTAALLLACVAFLSYELITFRGAIVQNVSVLAEVVGANCRAALVFNDQKSAEETLAALAAERHIVSAEIYAKSDDAPFAIYLRAGEKNGDFTMRLESGQVFFGGYLFLSKPIALDAERLGTISLKSDLRAMDERLQRYAGIVAIVLIISTLTAFLLSSKLQRLISDPVRHLVQTARTISERKDYSVRASKQSHDELGLLIDSFNDMLDQIHQHEEVLKASLREKDVLLKEIHHRVKNNLQVISSLLNLQSGAVTEPAVLAMFTESQNRIKSMALIHEKLYQSKDLARIDFAEYVRNLANHLYRSYVVNANLISLKLNIENIHLNVDTAIPCGLMLNELVSNALKYAFPHGQKGEIGISLLRQNGEQLVLVVKDNGVGLPQDFDIKNSKSLGLKLVNILTKQLKGDLNYHGEGGTEFRLAFSSKK
jgi:two-component sensor histidine kinase